MAILTIQVNPRCLKMVLFYSMFKNMGIDTKIKSLAKLTNLAIRAYFEWPKWPQMAVLATQVNLRCLKIFTLDFPCTITWG